MQGGGIELALGYPGYHLYVAQPPRSFLHVGLEIIRGVVEVLVAGDLFVPLGGEEFFARPEIGGAGFFLHRGEYVIFTGQQARFHEVGGHGDIFLRFAHAILE